MKEYKYKIQGITLSMKDMSAICEYYEAACTAEYLLHEYGLTDMDKALNLGYKVRNLMNKYDGYSEDDAIEEVLGNTVCDLPETVTVNINDVKYNKELDNLEEAILNYLSDTYGFCIESFDFDTDSVTGDITITNICWDTRD